MPLCLKRSALLVLYRCCGSQLGCGALLKTPDKTLRCKHILVVRERRVCTKYCHV